ncbi:hypothetical protein [Algicola sagamiensis]|uniref:hypothetical protein n=1 Tax=Algicola sagamiensis TaxID=163869 RepID=UPI0003A1D354|nr:hypothetical protein [Algicola sagamiensis]
MPTTRLYHFLLEDHYTRRDEVEQVSKLYIERLTEIASLLQNGDAQEAEKLIKQWGIEL